MNAMKRIGCFCLTLCLLLSLPLAFSSCEEDSPDMPSNAKILAKNKEMWTDYYRRCNAVNVPHSAYVTPDGREAENFIRCMYRVFFDNGLDYEGVYVYDIYLTDDDTGILYFYHLIGDNPGETYSYTLLQSESVSLTSEMGLNFIVLMSELNFENQPTWNPDEKLGMDGGTTYVYGRGNFGENLIVMREAKETDPHSYIRTAIEDLVRAHITVEEGMVYRPELYE